MVLDLPNVHLGHPRVSVNDRQQHLTRVNACRAEIQLFEVLGTPTNVTSLAPLLVLPNMVHCIADELKLGFKLLNQPFGFEVRVFFVTFHGQKDQVLFFGMAVFCQFIHGLSQQFFVFLVVGNDKSIENVGVDLPEIPSPVDFFPLHLFSSLEYPPVFEESEHCDSDEDEGLDGEVEDEEDTNFLVDDREAEGPCEHHHPSEDVNARNQQLVFVVVPEILHVHDS